MMDTECEACGLPYCDDPSSGDGHGHAIDCVNAHRPAAHTPGPWTAGGSAPGSYGLRTIVNSGGVGQVAYMAPGTPDADARLIAAAPDMLEALRYARDVIVPNLGHDDGSVEAIDAAIARATGVDR